MQPDQSPEQVFAAYARTREPALLEQVLRDHTDQAFTHARRVLGCNDLAEDAIQEACVRLVASAERYRVEIPFRAWWHRLVAAASIDQLRRRASRKRRVAAMAAMPSQSGHDDGEELDERFERVRDALESLPDQYRKPLTLYYFSGLDREGVASALGLRPGTVAVRITRAVQRLRQDLTRLGVAMSLAALVDLMTSQPSYAASPLFANGLTANATAGAAKAVKVSASAMTLKAAAIAVSLSVVVTASIAARAILASPGEKLVRAMPPDSWATVSNSKMQTVTPKPDEFPGSWGNLGPYTVASGWSGAALDERRDRLMIWGGGNPDYHGNEIYAFDLHALRWSRLTDPTVNPTQSEEANPDGTPTSRHSFAGLAYLSHVDRFFAVGSWCFDIDAEKWSRRAPRPGGEGLGVSCAYDADTHLLWWAGRPDWAGLWSYDFDTDTWTQRNHENFSRTPCAIDRKRRQLVFVGPEGVFSYDLAKNDFTAQPWQTTGGEALIGQSGFGFDYDPVADRFFAWSAGTVYELDPTTRAWTTHRPAGGPERTDFGTYTRWRYVPDLDAFVLVTSIDRDVSIYKPPR